MVVQTSWLHPPQPQPQRQRKHLLYLAAVAAASVLIPLCYLLATFQRAAWHIGQPRAGDLHTADIIDRPLILYAYHETEDARRNAEFFIRHALHDAADFLFIFNGGDTDLDTLLPANATNIRVIRRRNDCYDLGAFAEVLTKDSWSLYGRYRRFILMNASIRGPFVPHWAQAHSCWSDMYLDRVTDHTKLVGMTYNCKPARHVQSMIWATDSIGLHLLLSEQGINQCFHEHDPAVHAEVGATALITDAGYGVDVMMSAFHTRPDYARSCAHDDVLWNDKYYGFNVHPYETLFAKTNRQIAPQQLDTLTAWHDDMAFSSRQACARRGPVSPSRLAPEPGPPAPPAATSTATERPDRPSLARSWSLPGLALGRRRARRRVQEDFR
ncbi:MAG: hypothetical protein M1826_005655 [Phylliscum demangeonii]|nr:MAG: hypothetical protein M1826_005655 [Phylliscum demangeonii]